MQKKKGFLFVLKIFFVPLQVVTLRLLLLTALIYCTTLSAGNVEKVKNPNGRHIVYRLFLADKQGTPFSLDRPEEFLSQKAIYRRERQHLALDSTDLPIAPQYLQQIRATGVEIISKSKWNNSVLVRSRRHEALRKAQRLPFVRNYKYVMTGSDSLEAKPHRMVYHKEFTRWDTITTSEYGVTTHQTDMLGGRRLHYQGFRGKGMTIAVMDGGFMNADAIPSLMRANVVGTADLVFPKSDNIFRETDHGTMVFSTMAVNEPDHFIGTAPEASYWLIRCEDTQTESSAEEDFWAAAAEFADSVGVDVINSSVGYYRFDEKSTNYRYRQQDGQTALISRTASMLAGKGILLVNSVGNEGMGPWKRINFPSDARDILTVGAVSADGNNAAFSSIGPTADGRIKPDVMALGSPASVVNGRGTISKNVGTSFAAPQVAGLAACLWQARPNLSVTELIDIIRRSASQADYPDNIMGYGIPNFYQAYKR